MAIVTVGSGGNLYGPSGGRMESPDFAGWDSAQILEDGAVELRPAGLPDSLFNLTAITLRGTGLSITPNDASGTGPDIGTRVAVGTITSFSFLSGSSASHGSVSSTYSISGLSVSFASLIANAANPLEYLLSGSDQITGTPYGDILNGYAGDDTFLPGMSGRSGSIIDGGTGNDTVDFSGTSGRLTINLALGTVTPIGVSGLENSNSTLISIENAVGSTSDDTIIGSTGNNMLSGGSGVDTISGGDGDDVILPGSAGPYPSPLYYDNINGGAGRDTISFAGMAGDVMINLVAGTATLAQGDGAPPSARMVSIENATGGAGNDTITGNGESNVLSGADGNDIISGLVGNDRLFGGIGSDTLLGGDGNDILRGDEGFDLLNGGNGIDRADYNTSSTGVTVNLTNHSASTGDWLVDIENLLGSAYNDVLIGTAGANALYGGAGNDGLHGLAGNDRLEGQAGDDALHGGDGNDVLGGGDGIDGLFGNNGNDAIYGGNGNDYIDGGAGNDVLWGDAGNDRIIGGAGNDFVVLGLGNDAISLGTGDDRVRFDYGNGHDTIYDFGNGRDVIDFTATGMTRAVLQANAVETAQGVLLNVGSGSILLSGLHLWQMEWNSDFVFAA